jgi:RNA polymerase sigma-70 factor (ECF subfamily)
MGNEALLVSRAALLGDKNAYSQLVVAYQSPIRRFFFNLTNGDEERSKDLAQETFIKAWLHISSFQAAAKFSTWLYRIAYNLFYDEIRANKPTVDITHAPETGYDHSTDTHLNMDFAQALSVLKKEERTAMLLFYMEDLSVSKIAAIMNCPSGTVKSHLHRGKEKLAIYFKNSGYDK